jgi:hypothetical protein
MLAVIIIQVRSFSAMWMVMLTGPLGLIGSVPALLIFHQPFGFNAILGLIGTVSKSSPGSFLSRRRSRSTSRPPRASRPGWPGTAGWKAHRKQRWTSTTLGYWRTCPVGRERILTQETQIGKPAQELARTKPNPMLNAHQEWIDGLAQAAAQRARS